MKRYILQPIAFFIVGLAFYCYYGITWYAWLSNLPHILGYAAICGALSWSLYKKEAMKQKRK